MPEDRFSRGVAYMMNEKCKIIAFRSGKRYFCVLSCGNKINNFINATYINLLEIIIRNLWEYVLFY